MEVLLTAFILLREIEMEVYMMYTYILYISNLNTRTKRIARARTMFVYV